MKIIARLLYVIFVFVLSCNQDNIRSSDFIRIDGKQFIRHGKPYYFLGTNVWYGANLGMEGAKGDRKRLIRELDLLQSLGITNLRVMGASEGLGEYRQVKPCSNGRRCRLSGDLFTSKHSQ